MSDFRRTHHDNWQEHKQKFTEDQLLVLTDLLVSPCYYAWKTNKGLFTEQTLLTVSGLLTSSRTVAIHLSCLWKRLFTRFRLLSTFIIDMKCSSYSRFWYTGSDVRRISVSRGCDHADWSRNLDKRKMLVPSVTRSTWQLRDTLALRQSRIPVQCIVMGHRIVFQEPKNYEVWLPRDLNFWTTNFQ